MKRSILAFQRDEAGDLVARLDCGHRQHMRHRPPFIERPWTRTEAGRAAMIGKAVPCPLCDRLELPKDVEPTRATPIFEADSIPAGLRREHISKAGVWARIVVIEGVLRYTVGAPAEREFLLDRTTPGIVCPGVPHRVEPVGKVRFLLEFLRVPAP